LNTTDQDLAEFAARIARLEAELAETRRVNAAWRALHVRSELILHRIGRRLEAALQANPSSADGAEPTSIRFDAGALLDAGALVDTQLRGERRN
jgi:hypothetical protein